MAGFRYRGRLGAAAALGPLVLAAPAAAQDDGAGDLPINPEWLANTISRASTTTSVKNNTIDGALQRRDAAKAGYEAALKAGKKVSPLAKPEYLVVWSAKQNAGDVNASVISQFIDN